MIHLLIYDIESDRIRTKIAKACEEYGLERVQFSAFWGEMSANEAEELLLKCKELIGDDPARVHILPLCAQCFARRTTYSAGDYKGTAQQPRDQNAPIVFLPDTPTRRPDNPVGPAVPPAPTLDRARMDVARKLRRKDKPVGTEDDPWEDTPDD